METAARSARPHSLERDHVLACGHTVFAFPYHSIWCESCYALVDVVRIEKPITGSTP